MPTYCVVDNERRDPRFEVEAPGPGAAVEAWRKHYDVVGAEHVECWRTEGRRCPSTYWRVVGGLVSRRAPGPRGYGRMNSPERPNPGLSKAARERLEGRRIG
jgi:hypothetical protein